VGILQAHIGVHAQGHPLFLAVEAVPEPPPLPTGGGDFQIKPALIEQLDGLLAGLGVTDGGIGQRHGGNSL